MNEPATLRQAVDELGQLLSEETDALRRLDHQALESITERKTRLIASLSRVPRDDPDLDTARALAELRKHALSNQLLMIHARDLTQGVFDSMTGHSRGAPRSGARLLEVRG